jgi:hypothetical protein
MTVRIQTSKVTVTGGVRIFTTIDQGEEPPVWLAPEAGSIGEVYEGDALFFSSFFQATSPVSNPITYTEQTGPLPNVLTVTSSGNFIGGIEKTDPDKPTWNTTAGSLGTIDEGETLNTSVSATPTGIRTIDNYSMVIGNLPWGINLNSQTGQISGTELLLVIQGKLQSKQPPTTWNTAAGSLGTINEGDAFDTTLSANVGAGSSIETYSMISGTLPWGISLNQLTGQISGTELKQVFDGDQESVTPPVTWNTTSGSLGTVNEGDSFDTTLSATAGAGTTVTYSIKKNGSLPWGLTLNNSTGQISGFEQALVLEEPLQEITPKPTWTTGTNLGSHSDETAYSQTLMATGADTYWILSGSTAWGLNLNTYSGSLSGTLRAVSSSTLHTFTVRALNSTTGAFADRTFTLTVTP